MEGVGVATGIKRTGWGQVGTGKPCAAREGSLLSHLAHSADPGLQTVSSISAKMLDPAPHEDELKGKGEPGEKARSVKRMGPRRGLQAWGWERKREFSEHGGLLPVKVT